MEPSDEVTARLASCKKMLEARTTPDGKPKPGYRRNVAAVMKEIRRLEAVKS